MMRFTRMPSAILVLTMISIGSSAVAQPVFQLRDGVIVDRSSSKLYVMGRDSGIRVLEMRGGLELWNTNAASKPLALVDGLLVAQVEPKGEANMLELMSISTVATGQVVKVKKTALPPDVVVGIDQSREYGFLASALGRGDQADVVWYYSTNAVAQGIAPARTKRTAAATVASAGSPGIVAQAANFSSDTRMGSMRFNAKSGEVAFGDVASFTMDTLRRATVVGEPMRFFMRGGAASVAASPAGDPQNVFLSADGRHILESARVADDRVWEQYRWTVREADTLRPLGTIRSFMSVAPFFVDGDLIIFASDPYTRREEGFQPLKLRAVELSTGRERWSTEIRDTKFRGSNPP